MATIEERLSAIEERNRRVEADKAWETSWLRILSISVITYVVAVLLVMLNADPVGDAIEKAFGKGADRWAINIIFVTLLIYVFSKRK